MAQFKNQPSNKFVSNYGSQGPEPAGEEADAPGQSKKSFLSSTLLSNYLLGITLLKNVALRVSKEE